MEDTHTGARVERVKSYVSLYTVHSLLAVESWATYVRIAKLDLLTVVHINELLLHMFFNVFWKVARPCALFKCIFHVHFGPSISELYCTLQCHPWIKHQSHKNKGYDHQPKIVEQILLVSTLYSVENSMENIHTDDRV